MLGLQQPSVITVINPDPSDKGPLPRHVGLTMYKSQVTCFTPPNSCLHTSVQLIQVPQMLQPLHPGAPVA
jgi:hypothetical protein